MRGREEEEEKEEEGQEKLLVFIDSYSDRILTISFDKSLFFCFFSISNDV